MTWSARSWLPAVPVIVALSAAGVALVRRGRNIRLLVLAGAVLVATLAGPLERLSGTLLAAHMLQHSLLLSVAAPLLALAVPVRILPALMPAAGRRRMRPLLRVRRGIPWWAARATTVGLFTGVVWVWHAPPLYEGAAGHDLLHALEHATFLGVGVAFWWSVFGGRVGGRATGAGLLVLVAGTAPATALAALLAFAAPLYESYAPEAALWGMTPQEDQTLGAMAMWSLGGLAAAVAAAGMTVSWLEGGRDRTGSGSDLGGATARSGAGSG